MGANHGGHDEHEEEVALAPSPGAPPTDNCGAEEGSSSEALTYRLIGLFGILILSFVGFYLPFVLRGKHRTILFFFRGFAGGVVLSVAIIHILPDAGEALTNPCLGWSDKMDWASVICLFSIILTLMFEHYLRQYLQLGLLGMWRAHARPTTTECKECAAECGEKCAADCDENCAAAECDECAADEHGGEVQCVGGDIECVECGVESTTAVAASKQLTSMAAAEQRLQLENNRAAAITLDVGMVFHSVFVGIALGSSKDVQFVQGLAIALIFHQGFEGVSLGIAVLKAQLSLLKSTVMGLTFCFSAPIGVAIGLAVASTYNGNSPVALGIEGIFNAISSGILIYNSIVDLMVPTFHVLDADTPKNPVTFFLGFVFLLLGAAAMTILALWA